MSLRYFDPMCPTEIPGILKFDAKTVMSFQKLWTISSIADDISQSARLREFTFHDPGDDGVGRLLEILSFGNGTQAGSFVRTWATLHSMTRGRGLYVRDHASGDGMTPHSGRAETACTL